VGGQCDGRDWAPELDGTDVDLRRWFAAGATLLGVAAAERDAQFTSLVLWDPCESGRSYLRELSALEGLRRESYEANPDGSVETSEFVF